MALWRIVVKNSGNAACKDKRQRLEKGMFIYGAQNEGDGRGMVERWWKRLEFSGLGGRRGDGCAKRLVYIGLIWV